MIVIFNISNLNRNAYTFKRSVVTLFSISLTCSRNVSRLKCDTKLNPSLITRTHNTRDPGSIQLPVPQSHMTIAVLSSASTSVSEQSAASIVSSRVSTSVFEHGNTGGKQGDGRERPGGSSADSHPGCDQKLHLSAQAKYVTLAAGGSGWLARVLRSMTRARWGMRQFSREMYLMSTSGGQLCSQSATSAPFS